MGGGGLVQLPALLIALGPATAVVHSLATNKIASICGTSTSAVTYYRRVHPDLRTALPMAAAALVGALAGARASRWCCRRRRSGPSSSSRSPRCWSTPCAARDSGAVTALRHSGRRHHVTAGLIGLVIGVYDGAVGPGTGSFLVFALVSLVGYAFVEASAKAKIANVATNLGALVVFVPQGVVLWKLGLLMGVANLVGGYLGARTAVARGAGFVRVVFIVVSSVLLLRLAYDVLRLRP